MAVGNPNHGLLRAILRIIRTHPDKIVFDSDWVTGQLEEECFWEYRRAKSPARTVNSYFSQNRHIFQRMEPNRYRLIR